MEIMIFCGIYLVELVCYLVVLRMLFDVQVRTKVWMMAGVLLPVVIGSLPIDDAAGKNMLITMGVVVIIYISFKGKIVEKIIWLLLAFLFLECIDGIFTQLYEVFNSYENNNFMRNYNYLIVKSCSLLSILLLKEAKSKVVKYKKMHINSAIYLLIGLITVLMMICLGILNYVIKFFPSSKYIILCKILNIVILISIFLLLIFIIYIKKTHERMEQLLKTERLLKESQVNYYKQVLKKENDTRKYRHDMVNHLIYVKDLLSRNRIYETQEYLTNILGGFEKIQKTYYVIGNEMIDTIMNYFFGMLPKNVKVDIKGKCPVKIDMEDIDICTIFSNLFLNVVEEIVENKLKNANIIIEVRKGKQYAEYDIKNSLSHEINEKLIDKNGLPKTCKQDKRNHGIGMLNIKKTIERNNGKFEWYQKDGYFCVSVILPIL